MSKHKVGDIVTLGDVSLKIVDNPSGLCDHCYLRSHSKSECLKACNLFGDCFDFSKDNRYVKFVRIRNNQIKDKKDECK